MSPAAVVDRRARRALGAVLVGAFALITFAVAARLDPEPYHDGAQAGPAIALADGLVIHRQVFDSYGPITAWIQGAAVTIFPPTVLTMRLVMAVVLTVVALLMLAIGRLTLRSTAIAAALTVLWVVMWPGQAVSWGTPLLPWPSITFLLFQLATVLLVLRRCVTRVPRPVTAAVAGAALALAMLTRANYGIPLAAALLVALALLARPSGITRRELLAATAGLAAGLLIPLAYLAATAALVPFFDQALIGPLMGDASSNASPWVYLKSAFLWGALPLLLGLGVLYALARGNRLGRWVIPVVGTVFIVMLTVWTSTAIVGSPVRELILTKLTWAPAMDVQAIQPMFLSADIAVLLGVALAVVLTITWLRSRAATHTSPRPTVGRVLADSSEARVFVVLTLVSCASLVQLFPIADPNHLWWAAPLPLILLATALTRDPSRRDSAWITALLVVPYLAVCVWSAHNYLARPRIEISSGVMAGMLIQDDLMGSVAAVDSLLLDVDPRSARFLCDQGLFAVWSGRYLSDSPAFVQWAFRIESAEAPPRAARVFMCTPPDDTTIASEFAAREGYAMGRVLPSVHLSDFTRVGLVELIDARAD